MTMKGRQKEAESQSAESVVRQELARVGYQPPQIDEMVRAAQRINRGEHNVPLSAPWMQGIVDHVCILLRGDAESAAERLRQDISFPYARLSTGAPPVRAVPTPVRLTEREYTVSIGGTRYYVTLTGPALSTGRVDGMDTQHQLLQALEAGRVARVTSEATAGTPMSVQNFEDLYSTALENPRARVTVVPTPPRTRTQQ